MNFVSLLFYVFAIAAVSSALMVVASKNPVRGVLFLVATFVATAGIWMLLEAEFLALVLVLVYVGAVMTLFLFVVMMLSVRTTLEKESFVPYLPLVGLILLLMCGVIFVGIGPHHFGLNQMPLPTPAANDFSNIASLGAVLYTNYAYPFEIAAVLLLTAIVAAISLSHRPAQRRKSQNIAAQIAVKSEDRVRLINMPSEPKTQAGPKTQEEGGV